MIPPNRFTQGVHLSGQYTGVEKQGQLDERGVEFHMLIIFESIVVCMECA